MANSGAVLLLVALLPAAAILRGTINNMDLTVALNDMHPEQVGKLLQTVELKWEEARASALRNLTDENVGLEDMVKSCSKVGMAIIGGSDGDKDKVVEYMNDVCAASESDQCKPFASGIEGTMTDDAGFNRNELQLAGFCQSFWSGPVTNAAKMLAQKAEEEDAIKAKEEAKAEEEKASQVLAATTEKESQAANEAVNKTAEAIQHAAKVEEEIKDLEGKMDADATEATKALDSARQEEQVASEKEAKAAETKASDATVEADVAKATEEGDAKADAIAAKALEKPDAEAAPSAGDNQSSAAASDDAEAIAAGDAEADKIAENAVKKAALVAAKQHKFTKNTTAAEKNVTKNVEVAKKNVTASKNVTKNVTKKF
jgi:hypothetical protein